MVEPKVEYKNRPVTANSVVIFETKILLIKRLRDPYKDMWAIPGGFVEINESTKEAAVRELNEECGVEGEVVDLVGIYDDPNRDLIRNTVNISYLIRLKEGFEFKAGDDAGDVRWFEIDNLPDMAFDHQKIVMDAVAMIK